MTSLASSETSPRVGTPEEPGSVKQKFLQIAVIGLPVIVLATLAWRYRNISDDGYIYLHIVQQILAGHGPVFNTGQRVEVYTGPLWVFIVAFAGLVTPFALEWIAVFLGLVFTLGGVMLSIVGSIRIARQAEADAFFLPLGLVVVVAVFPFWTLATAGLETGLTFGWLGLCMYILANWMRSEYDHIPWNSLIALGLGPLVRPELAIDTAAFLFVLVWAQRADQGWGRRIRTVVWMAAIPFAYQVFRMGYFGMLVANTAIAKEATKPRLSTGMHYLWNFLSTYAILIPLAALTIGALIPLAIKLRQTGIDQRAFWALVALPGAGICNAAYITFMGGDYIHARLLLPALFAICAPVAVVPVGRRYLVSLIVIPWAVICAVGLRPSGRFALPVFPNSPGVVTATQQGWGPGGKQKHWYSGPGIYYDPADLLSQAHRIYERPAPGLPLPSDAVAGTGLVAFGMGTNLNILDLLGLASPIDAHFVLGQRGFPGHEKPFPTYWVIAQMTAPGSSVVPFDRLQTTQNQFNPQFAAIAHGQELAIKTAWARAALQCPAIKELGASATAPLTFGQLTSNFLHAFSRTTLRIPTDPKAAYHRFCGPGTPAEVTHVTGSP